MTPNFSKKAKDKKDRSKPLRAWNLAKRLDPKQMSEEKKKKGFSKLGNK